jgi:uncharacterized membrane protein
MIQYHPNETKSVSGSSYPGSSRVEKFYAGLGIACFIAWLVLAGLGFGRPGQFLGALGLLAIFGIVRTALVYKDESEPPQDPSEITPAQRVRNAHRKPDR